MRAEDALALAKSYVKKSLAGAGALKGDKGEKGDKGDTGKSAYELWLDDGNTGSEDDFLASLKGEKGDTGEKGTDGKTPVKGTDYWTEADKEEIVNDVLAQITDGNEVAY